MRVHGSGSIQWVKTVDVAKLADADAAHDPKAEHRFPEERDVVYVTGANGYHAQLGHVPPGHKVAFQGRIYELVAGAAPGEMQIGYTGIVVNRVAQTFKRKTDTLIDLTLRYAESGREGVISGTPEHPFFVPARNDYVPMGKLEPGTVLRTDDGSTASVVASKTKHGDFEVFNLEVENAHNYFVSAKGEQNSCGQNASLPGVLVHNDCAPKLFDIIPYSKAAPGFEKHHGVLDAWARANIPGYAGRAAPSVVLTPAQHNATRAVFNTWRAEMGWSRTAIDWTRVSAQEMQGLTNRMFQAAGVPADVAGNYFRSFTQYIYGL
jgi:hypothetical protein